MTTWEHQPLLDHILHAIAHEDLVLPTLPEVAIKLQNLITDPNNSAEQIVDIISGDPFISGQLIKAANGAAFADKPRACSVRMAASRLGFRQLHDLVMDITMNQMVFSNNPILNKRMQAVLVHSREVAMVSYVLALRYPHLSPDQAMLAGLVHDIGILPLCLHIEKNHVQITEETLNELIRKCHSTIGAALLKKWNFPPELIKVAEEHEDTYRDSGDNQRADYTDIVCVANLQNRVRSRMTPWNQSAAARRLLLSEEEYMTFLDRQAGYITLVEERLGITSTAKSASVAAPPFSRQKQTPVLPPASGKRGVLSSFMSMWG